MAIIKQFDKRSGITYVYESKSYYDKEKKCSRAKRTLIGKLDPDTGELIPTDGRNKGARSPVNHSRIDTGALAHIFYLLSHLRKSGPFPDRSGFRENTGYLSHAMYRLICQAF